MFKSLKILIYFIFFVLKFGNSQSIDGIQEIVKMQQDIISILEDNLKKLIGSIEEQSNLNQSNANSKLIENKINDINQKLRLLESNVNNLTNLAYNLDFALKRIERHLELSSIQEKNDTKNVNNLTNNKDYKVVSKPEIKQEGLNPKTKGVLGFIKENDNKEENQKKRLLIKGE